MPHSIRVFHCALLPVTLLLVSCGLPKNVVVLLPDADGHVGTVTIENPSGQTELNRPLAAVGLKTGRRPGTPFIADQQDVKNAFSPVFAATPPKPVIYILYFGTGDATIEPSSKTDLDAAVAAAKERSNVDISVVGHTDATGDAAANLDLSLRRAHSVRDALVGAGISENVIEVTYHGANNPQVPAGPGISEPRNRRVEITIR